MSLHTMSVIEFFRGGLCMSVQPDDLNAILSRITALERENRRTKTATMIAVLIAVAVITMGQVRSSRTIEATKLIVRDSSGKTRVVINGDAPDEGRLVHGGNISILDDEAQPIAEIGTMHRASFLELRTAGEAQPRTALTSASWELESQEGSVFVGITTRDKSKISGPSISLFDSGSHNMLSIPSKPW
jgi:hypothetical protein